VTKPRRDVAILFRVTFREKQQLQDAARRDPESRSISDYVRDAALDRVSKEQRPNVKTA
jgi:hypothetical protein